MDPFTQKMVERSKARKEYLDAQFAKIPQPAPRKRRSPLKEDNVSTEQSEIPEKNQINDDDSVGKRQCLAPQNMSELPRSESRRKESKENLSASKITSQTRRGLKALARLHSNPGECSDNEDEEPAKPEPRNQVWNERNPGVDTPIPKDRINRLAALASNINKWEDDSFQGCSKTKSAVRTKTDAALPRSSRGSSSSANSDKTPSKSSSPSKRSTINASANSPSRATPKLCMDTHKSPAKASSSSGKVGRSSSTTSSSVSSKRRSSSFSSLSPPHANKRSSQNNSPSGAPQQNSKRVVWDQAIVATLQAQGFVQSPSKSKLEYNFRKTSVKNRRTPEKKVDTESESESENEAEKCIEKSEAENSIEENATKPSTSRFLESFKTPPKSLVEPAKKSVKELAQKFTGPPRAPVKIDQRDPAELPLSARVALFEKEAENASDSRTNFSSQKRVSRLSFSEKQSSRNAPSASKCSGSQFTSPVKKIAKMSPVRSDTKSPAKNDDKSPSKLPSELSVSPSKVGKHTFQLHRKLFEHVSDDWKENEISAKIREERQKDMEVVLNRWSHKNKVAAVAATSSVHGEGRAQASSAHTPIATTKSLPSKLPEQVPKAIPPPPPLPGHANVVIKATPAVRSVESKYIEESSSDEEVDEMCEEDSYKSDDIADDVANYSSEGDEEDAECAIRTLDEAIPDVRDGVYSDTENDDNDVEDEDSPNETGLDSSILQAAFTKVTPLKNPYPKPPRAPEPYVSPVRKTQAPVRISDHYQQQARDEVRDVETPLMHTVSFYRRQKETIRLTPVRQVVRRQELLMSPPETIHSAENSPRIDERADTIQDKIKDLQEEVNHQQIIIHQSSQALTLCRSTSEFHGSPEQIEGEKLLLIATQKLTACLNEIKRLKTDGAIGADVLYSAPSSKGSLSITDIRLPLKKAYLEETANGKIGEFVSFFLCLVKFRSLVIATQMVSTHDCISNGVFSLPNLINIRDLNRDFNVVVEVYGLQTKRENITKQQKTLANKKEKSRLALTPKKRQSKRDLRMASPAVHGAGSSSSVCTSSFDIIGFAALNLKTLQRKSWALEKCPHNSPLDGNIFMKVQCHTDVSTSKERSQGFLTMFEDVGGFGAWHRRWFDLSSRYISFWKYPDDVKRKDPIGTIDLCKCITPEVGLVSRDICARPHTFMLLTVKPPSKNEENTLVSQSYSSYTVNKILLSADTKDERISWCQQLNRAIDNLRSWDPEALRPIPIDSATSK